VGRGHTISPKSAQTPHGSLFEEAELRRPSYELGVLFIHGIGQPCRGDTLVRFGDPLCECIRDWCDGAKPEQPNDPHLTDPGETLNLCEAFIDPRGDDPRASPPPPHVELHLKQTFNGQSVTNTWLLVESWWPKSFITPRYWDLAWWGLLILPGIFASHCGEQGYRWWNQLLRCLSRLRSYIPRVAWILLLPVLVLTLFVSFVILTIGYVTFSLAAGLVSVVVVALLLVLAIPPIPRLRSALLTVQRALVGTVGDSYVFLTSPIQEAAIVSRLVSDIRWMRSRCTRLAIVAHSQGAAISDLALRTGVLHEFDSTQAVLLITFGSGLKKLNALKHKKKIITQCGWLAIMGFILLFTGMYLIAFTDLSSNELHADDFRTKMTVSFGGIFLFVGAILWLATSLSFPLVYRFTADDVDPVQRFGIGLRWHDYYASMDPVPNGPLLDDGNMPSLLKSNEVHNYSSPWSDHTTYWKNKDGFVAQIASVISQFAEFPLINSQTDDNERLIDSMRRRRWRVGWLMAARALTFMTAVALLIANNDGLGQISSEISKIFLTYWNVSLASKIQLFLPISDAMTQWLIGGGGVISCVLIAYLTLIAVWWIWNEVDTKALFLRSAYKMWPFWLFVSLFLLLLDIALFVRFGWLAAAMLQPERFSLVIFAPPLMAALVERVFRTFAALPRLLQNAYDFLDSSGIITNEIQHILGDIIFWRMPFLSLLIAPLSAWLASVYDQHVLILVASLTAVHLGLILYYNTSLREVLEKGACVRRQASRSFSKK
jgi:hypothetical protein